MSLKISGYRVQPLVNDAEDPVVLHEHRIMFVSQKYFNEMVGRVNVLQRAYNRWCVHREEVLPIFEEIAKKLDDTQLGTNIANITGAGVGIAGGIGCVAAIVFPPLIIPAGIALGVSAVNGATTGITKAAMAKAYGNKINEILKKDSELLEKLQKALEAYQAEMETMAETGFGEIDADRTDLQIASDVMAGLQAAPAAGIACARVLMRTSAQLSANVLKGVGSALAGIGIALDIATIIIASLDLAKGSRCELSKQIREVAAELVTQKIELEGQFKTFIEG